MRLTNRASAVVPTKTSPSPPPRISAMRPCLQENLKLEGLGARPIAKRSGNGKARVALARKLSVILHSVWRSGEPFRWSEEPTELRCS
jgi:hypothetical protein